MELPVIVDRDATNCREVLNVADRFIKNINKSRCYTDLNPKASLYQEHQFLSGEWEICKEVPYLIRPPSPNASISIDWKVWDLRRVFPGVLLANTEKVNQERKVELPSRGVPVVLHCKSNLQAVGVSSSADPDIFKGEICSGLGFPNPPCFRHGVFRSSNSIPVQLKAGLNKENSPNAECRRYKRQNSHAPLRISVLPRTDLRDSGYKARDIVFLIFCAAVMGYGCFHLIGWLTEPRDKNDSR